MGDLLFYLALGVILGGRFGYVVFYNFDVFLADPLWLLRVWEGGMAFHGGLLGVIFAMWWYGRKIDRGFWQLADFVAPLVPVGLGAGRIGNFINGELWGKPTDAAWGMVFRTAPDSLARHPSQLYQFALEGVVLFVILWWFSARPRPRMAVSGLFLAVYGAFRFMVEFVRQPDPQLGYLAFDWLTMGQVLSLPMVLAGATLMFIAYRRNAE
jgi:phosphatidylglycerol:prolipoprotein diacylglycerol transferase